MTNQNKILQELLERKEINKEKNRKSFREYYQNNKEKHIAMVKANYDKNKDDPYFQAKVVKKKIKRCYLRIDKLNNELNLLNQSLNN